MKKLAYLPLLLCFQAKALELPVIYGEDNRVEVKDATAFQKELARSTAVMVPKSNIKKRLFSKKASLRNVNSFTDQVLEYEGVPLCEEERFRKETSAGICSGFLIGADIMVTAGHCMMTQKHCKDHEWVFDFSSDGNGKYSIEKKNVYSCEKLLAWKNDFITGVDYAIIKLSRRVEDRRPLDIRRKGKIEDNAEVMVIGNPYGMTTKVAAGATVVSNEDETFFVSDLDALQGSSGSAVFNSKSGVVEGILVRGEEDFEYDYDKECFKSKHCEDASFCRGEDVLRITELPDLRAGGKAHTLARTDDTNGVEDTLKDISWIDVIDEQGASPLMTAARYENLDVVSLLLSMGADINHQDINGNTALHVLASLGKTESQTYEFLLKNGAKTSVKNVRGQTVKAIEKGLK